MRPISIQKLLVGKIVWTCGRQTVAILSEQLEHMHANIVAVKFYIFDVSILTSFFLYSLRQVMPEQRWHCVSNTVFVNYKLIVEAVYIFVVGFVRNWSRMVIRET